MHGSDFIASGFYDNQAKDLKELSHHTLEPEDFIGVGMSQELAPPGGGRSSRTAVMAPYDASSSPSAAGRWAHHRAPSWTQRAATMGSHPVSQQHSEVQEHLANEDSVPTALGKRSKTVPVIQPARPSPPARMLSEDGAATATAGPDTGSVEDASVTIPPRVQSARSRTTSSSSRGPMPRTTSSRSITSTLSTSPSDEFSGAIRPGVSPRKSSLRPTKQLINAALGQNPMPVPIRKASVGAASSTTGDASEMSHDADGSSRYSVPSSRRTTNSSRTWLRSPTDSLVINSDQTSVDVVDDLGDEFAHLVHSHDLESAQAVKVIEDGQGVIVEAQGRALESLEREVGPNTTHLLLSGSQDPELMSFLERSLPVMSQSLLVLDLSHTSLAELPVGLQSCSKLEELNISKTPLQRACLPSWIGNISSLRVLIADDLGLVSLPYALTDLYSLSILSIRRNKLDHLPTWLHLLTKLERLLLEGNAFKGAWARVVGPGPSKPIDRSVSSGSLGCEAGSALRGHFSPSSSCDSAYQKLGQSPASAVRSSMFSGASPVDPVSPNEVAQRTLRKPKLGRMRSDFDLRLPSTWKGGNVGPDESCDSFETASSSQTKVEELTPRSKATTPDERVSSPLRGKGDRDGKWGLLRKVGRKASSSNSRLLALGTADHEDDLSGKHTVGRGAESFGRRAVSAGTFMTSTGAAAGMTPSQQAEKPKATLGAAWQPTPHNVSHLQTRRKSFLPLETVFPTQHAPAVSSDDPRETQARVKALLCYLRDLDDLAPGALARRTGELDGDHMSSALRDSQSSHSLSNRDRPLSNATDASRPSPIERMRSNPLLRTTTPSSTDSPAEIKDDTRRRRRIIEEIISSEESYIKGLQELCDIYVKPARLPADGNNGQPILSPAELRAIFGNVEGLLQFHSGAFLPSLKTAAVQLYESDASNSEQDAEATAKVAEGIAAVFLKHGAFFRMYSAYINGCDAAQTKLTAWLAPSASTGGNAFLKSAGPGSAGGKEDGKGELSTSQKKKFKAFMRKCRADPRHRQLNIDSYLLLPVQRIPRYELLLKDLTKSTDPRRLRDPTSVQAALTQISSIANSVNESKRQSEQDRKLMAWQARISGKAWNETPLLQPHRRLVKDGALTLLRIVYRQSAFDTTVNLDDVEENLAKDGAFAPGIVALAKQTTEEQGRWRIDCLSQKLLGEKVTMLLCNDLCAVVKEVSDPLTRTPGSSNGIASPASIASPPATAASPGEGPVELFTTLKMRGGPTSSDDSSTSVPSSYCQLSGPTLLRIVDGHQIFYFSTTTHREAKEWCEVLNNTMVSGGGIMAAGRRRRSSAADWLGGSV